MAKQKAAVSLVPSSVVLSDACEWEQLCCCCQYQIWCCLSSQIYVVILASLKEKKKILFVYVIFLNKQSLFPLIHSQFPLSLFRPSKPTRLSQFSLLQSHSVRSLFISCSRGWDAASIRILISWLGATNRVFHLPAIFLDCIILKANKFLRIKDPRVSSVASWIPLSFLYVGQHQQGG